MPAHSQFSTVVEKFRYNCNVWYTPGLNDFGWHPHQNFPSTYRRPRTQESQLDPLVTSALNFKKKGETAGVSIAEFIMRYHATYWAINDIHIDRYELWIYHLQISKNIISTPPMRSSCTRQHLRDVMGGQTAAQSRPVLDSSSVTAVFFPFAVNPGQWQYGNFSGAKESRVYQATNQQKLTFRRKVQLGLLCFP